MYGQIHRMPMLVAVYSGQKGKGWEEVYFKMRLSTRGEVFFVPRDHCAFDLRALPNCKMAILLCLELLGP